MQSKSPWNKRGGMQGPGKQSEHELLCLSIHLLSYYYPSIHRSIHVYIYIYIVLCIYIHSLITDGKTCCICFSAPEGDQQTCPYLGQIPEGAATCRNCTPQELLPSSSSTYTFLNPQAKVRAMWDWLLSNDYIFANAPVFYTCWQLTFLTFGVHPTSSIISTLCWIVIVDELLHQTQAVTPICKTHQYALITHSVWFRSYWRRRGQCSQSTP